MKNEDIYYQAMLARDNRFDGKFFVGVKTTGIYCRPICPAKPKRQNVEFFPNYLEAEKAGYRPCMRCRPESAPDSPIWIGKSAIVRRALRIIHSQEALDLNEDKFADLFGVTARHLRRTFVEEIGKTPKQVSTENRLNLARKLIVETNLKMSEIAYAAGFKSIRRFNDAFKLRFTSSPVEVRRKKSLVPSGINISLSYRPPFDFDGLLSSYKNHRVGLLERFEPGKMIRVVSYGDKTGEITISNDSENSKLNIEINFSHTAYIHNILTKVKSLFDLDSDPAVIANSLEIDPAIKSLLQKHSGIRLPSGWDSFEVGIATILGQLVSVERGRSLVADLIDLTGKDSGLIYDGRPVKLFPSPKSILEADLTNLKTTGARKETLKAFSRAIHNKELTLESTQDIEEFYKKLKSIKGIGEWTASYIALKAIRHTDAFPSTDLIIARTLAKHPQATINKTSPWRGYVAALLWKEYAKKGLK